MVICLLRTGGTKSTSSELVQDPLLPLIAELLLLLFLFLFLFIFLLVLLLVYIDGKEVEGSWLLNPPTSKNENDTTLPSRLKLLRPCDCLFTSVERVRWAPPSICTEIFAYVHPRTRNAPLTTPTHTPSR